MPLAKADIILVDAATANATATRLPLPLNASDWSTAVNDLQVAIDAAQANDEIWVKAGIYYPTAYPLDAAGFPTGNYTRDYTFYIEKTNLGIYGGFAGNETLRNQRDVQINVSRLSGDLGTLGSTADNSYHVVITAYVDNTTVLDGFTISDGYGAGSNSGGQNSNYNRTSGGGLYNVAIRQTPWNQPVRMDSHPVLENLIFENNHANEGGALFNYSGFGGVGNPIIRNSSFISNSCSNIGGAVHNRAGSMLLEDCTFDNNSSTSSGEALALVGWGATTNAIVRRCSFTNQAQGATVYLTKVDNYTFYPLIEDCSFIGNNSHTGGAIYADCGTVNFNADVRNCVFAGNTGYAINTRATLSATLNFNVENCLFRDNVLGNIMAVNVTTSSSGTNNTNITNCTFAKNSGGVTANRSNGTAANAVLKNCILWDNTYNINSVNNDFYNSYGNIQVSHTITTSMPSNVTNVSNNQIGVNPQFVDASNNDYHLQFCSPALDAGDNSAVTLATDLDGMNRVENTTVDMGAYENPIITNILTSTNTTLTADYEITTYDGWTYYFNDSNTPANRSDDIVLLALKKNGNNIGVVGDGTFQVQVANTSLYNTGAASLITNPPANYVVNGSPWYVMNKFWDVTPTTQPTTDIEVRTFFDNNDITDLNGSLAPTTVTATDLFFYKINGTAYDPNPDNGHANVPQATAYNTNGYWQYAHGATASSSTWALGDFCGAYTADYVIAQFTGGGGGTSSAGSGALPVEWLTFDVNLSGKNDALLEWTVASETNNYGFEVERSTGDGQWEYLGFVRGNGTSAEEAYFSFVDRNLNTDTYYYRLKQLDFDGTYEYSEMKTLKLEGHTEIRVYPNPVVSVLTIQKSDLEDNTLNWEVLNSNGQPLKQGRLTSEVSVDMQTWPAGIYIIRIQNDNNEILSTRKVMKTN